MNNRELSRREQFMYYDAEAKFRYEGIRPSGIRGKELPVKLVLELVWRSEAVYWLYPEQEMTEAQLLYIAKEEFAGIPEEEYRPKEGQISYGSLRERLCREMDKHHIQGIGDMEAVKIYPFYRPAPKRAAVQEQDVWEVKVCCKGRRDYEVKLNADNGVLIECQARPEGWFDRDREPQPFSGRL